MARLLETPEVTRQLLDLPGWQYDARSLRAAYQLPDFATAARFVAEVADEAETMDHHPDLDLRWRTVTLRCSTHSAGGVTQLDIELAHRAREWAQRLRGGPTEPTRRFELALDTADRDAVLPFWRAALGYQDSVGHRNCLGGEGAEPPNPEPSNAEPPNPELYDPHGAGPTLWFQPMDPVRRERGRFHLDVYLPPADAVRLRDQLVGLGGTITDDSHAPQWWVVADPEGNECCVCVPDA
jgi:4a-hydroxytetrahydrobiopterin dehydratase